MSISIITTTLEKVLGVEPIKIKPALSVEDFKIVIEDEEEEKPRHVEVKKIIEDPSIGGIQYPCGEYIQQSLPGIRRMGKIIRNYFNKEKEIVLLCSGSSGAIISALLVPILSTNKRTVWIVHAPKEGEHPHRASSELYERRIRLNRMKPATIFVDDFIRSGSTLERCIKTYDGPINGIVVGEDVNQYILNRVLKQDTLDLVACVRFYRDDE